MNYLQYLEDGKRVVKRYIFPEPKQKKYGDVYYRGTIQQRINNLINEQLKNNTKKDNDRSTQVSPNNDFIAISSKLDDTNNNRNTSNQLPNWAMYNINPNVYIKKP